MYCTSSALAARCPLLFFSEAAAAATAAAKKTHRPKSLTYLFFLQTANRAAIHSTVAGIDPLYMTYSKLVEDS